MNHDNDNNELDDADESASTAYTNEHLDEVASLSGETNVKILIEKQKVYHEQIISAFVEYLKWSQKFDEIGTQLNAVKARHALNNLRRAAQLRKIAIFQERVALYGHVRKGIPPAVSKDSPQYRRGRSKKAI